MRREIDFVGDLIAREGERWLNSKQSLRFRLESRGNEEEQKQTTNEDTSPLSSNLVTRVSKNRTSLVLLCIFDFVLNQN